LSETVVTQGFDQRPANGAPQRETPDFAALSKLFPKWDATDLEVLWDRNDELRAAAEFKYFLSFANANDLDPMRDEVVAAVRWNSVKRRRELTPLVTIGVFRKRRGEYCDGIDPFEFEEDPKGKWPLSASGKIYRKESKNPFCAKVWFSEYAPQDENGYVVPLWAAKGHMMLSKVLEAQLTRIGFYDKIGDMLIDEETQQRDAAAPKPAADEYVVGEKEPANAKVESKPDTTGSKPAATETAESKPAVNGAADPERTPGQRAGDKFWDGKDPKPEAPTPAAPTVSPKLKSKAVQHKEAAEATAPTPEVGQAKPSEAALDFDFMIAEISRKIGGPVKDAHMLIRRYLGAYLNIPAGTPTPKERTVLNPPIHELHKACNFSDSCVEDLRSDPEGLGIRLSGRIDPLEEEFGILNWPANVRLLARKVLALQGQAPNAFREWIHMPIAGQPENGTGLEIAAIEPAGLEIFFPLFLLVKGRAFEILDWAIANGQNVTHALQQIIAAAGTPVDQWNAKVAAAVIDTLKNSKAADLEPKKQAAAAAPPADEVDKWASAGLPFED
jgi:hypothetical protein